MSEHADVAISKQLASEMPGFWPFFYERHPEMKPVTDAGPIGHANSSEVYRCIGEAITAYVREGRLRA